MSSHPIRVLCESKTFVDQTLDALTEKPLGFWRGDSLEIQIALTDYGKVLTAADVGVIKVGFKHLTDGPDDPLLQAKDYGSGDCDAAFDGSQWVSNSLQLLTASFTVDEVAFNAGDYRLVIIHTTSAQVVNTYLSTKIIVHEDFHDNSAVNPPVPLPPVAYTKAEVDALLSGNVPGTFTTENEDLFWTSPLGVKKRITETE